jgi:hypothetical protein
VLYAATVLGFLVSAVASKYSPAAAAKRSVLVGAVLPGNGYTIVQGIQFGFFALASGTRVGRVFAKRQPESPAVFTPFQVIRAFWVSFWLPVDQDKIRLNSAIRRQDYRALPQALAGLDCW